MTVETLIKCLEIAKKYSSHVAAEHDVIYFGGPNETNSVIGRELETYGAYYDEDIESWSAFV